MAHYALVNNQNIVEAVVVADGDPMYIEHLKNQAEEISGRWIQTSYNTRENIHYNPDGTPSGQPGLRKNYAGIFFTYSDELDAFLPPKPFDSWILDENKYVWKAPTDRPTDDKRYFWNEDKLSWEEDDINRVETLKFSSFEYTGSKIFDKSVTDVRII